jgi:large subunit ribosomal protein L15
MKLHTRTKTTVKKAKRLGHGYGSGKGGHTSSRGQKGQKARNGVRLSFTGSSWVWFKRLPFIRGKSRFDSLVPERTLTLTELNRLEEGAKVTVESLYKAGLLTKREARLSHVKIVGTGTITKKLDIMVPATASAVAAITSVGGAYRVTEAQ